MLLANFLNKKAGYFKTFCVLTGLSMFEKEYELPEQKECNVCSSKMDSKVCFNIYLKKLTHLLI